MVLESLLVEPPRDRHQEARDEGPALVGALLELRDDVLVLLRFEVLERDVLQFALDRVETQLVGDLRVEVHRLPALLAPLLVREHPERAHHLEAVGQLDEDHARVFGVADDQVAEVVGLLLGHLEPQFGDVRQPHGDAHDLLAEAFADVGRQREELLGRGVLVCDAHDVVQDRRKGGVATETHFGDHDQGDGYPVVEQRRAVVAPKAVELFGGIRQRLVDELLGMFREVLAHRRAEFFIP